MFRSIIHVAKRWRLHRLGQVRSRLWCVIAVSGPMPLMIRMSLQRMWNRSAGSTTGPRLGSDILECGHTDGRILCGDLGTHCSQIIRSPALLNAAVSLIGGLCVRPA